jgi:hypothetical protein
VRPQHLFGLLAVAFIMTGSPWIGAASAIVGLLAWVD